MKKFLSLILAAILIFATVPMGTFTFNVSAATEYTEGDYKYTVDGAGYATITKYTGSANSVTIPSKLGGYEVIIVGSKSFESKGIKSVIIPDCVTTIDNHAFIKCSNLTNITFSNSLTKIGDYTFEGCKSLVSVVIPDSVTYIGEGAFYGATSLKNVTLSKNVTYLGGAAFYGSVIESIEIPKSLDDCGQKWYYEYKFDGLTYKNLFGGPFVLCDNLKTVTFEKGTTLIADSLLMCCTGIEEIVIPDTVTTIEDNAFENCLKLNKLTIGDSVTTIGNAAFKTCDSLTSVDIPDSVTHINGGAFQNCRKLKNVKLSNNLIFLGGAAFGSTIIESIHIPKSLENCDRSWYYEYKFGDTTFSRLFGGPFLLCEKLKTVTFEEGTQKIANNLFKLCTGLKTVVIPDTVTQIGDVAFKDCFNLESLTIGSSVTSIGGNAFYGCRSLTEVVIPNSVTAIGGNAFAYCEKLEDVTLSKNLKSLGGAAFACTALKTVEIPKTLESCGDAWYYEYKFGDVTYTRLFGGPFTLCEDLKTVTFEEGTTKIFANQFRLCTGLEEVVVPDTVTVIGANAFDLCFNLKTIDLGNGVQEIGDYAFSLCASLENVEIPDSVTGMSTYVFNKCYALESVKLPNQRQNIMAGTFCECKSLKTIDFPKTVTTIQEYAFQNCTSLENFTFSEGESNLIEIHKSAFEGCTALKEVILPESTTTIREYAFKNCDALTKVYIPQSTKTIGREVFNGCDLLSDVTISDYSITTLTSQTFKDCPALKKITLPKGLTKIESQAFNNCTALVEVYIPESVTSISTDAFSYPDKTTIYGKSGSYAETFAKDNNFKFVDNTVAAEGIALLDGIESITLERGETYRAEFEFFPEDSTDVITLAANNGNVSINGMDINARYAGETVITATASSGVTYEFTVHIRDAKGISITKQPDKLTYLMGEALDTTGMIVQVNYSDSTTEEVTDYTITGFDSSKEGECTVTVQWISAYGNTYKSTFTVTIVDPRPKLTGIYISSLPNKLEYERKESLNLEGLVVNGIYTDGSDVAIEDYQVSGFNPLKNGVQTITITSGDFTTTFTVTVGIKLESIKISKLPNKTKYYIGESIDISGMELTLVYTDGSETVVTEGFAITGFDSDTVGEKTITVTYGAFSQTFVVVVNDKNAVKSGDINNDGNINNKDLGLLMQHLNNWDVEIVTDAADVNGDGSVNNKDYGLLMQYLNNWDVELK